MTEQLNTVLEQTHKSKHDSKTYAIAFYGGMTLALLLAGALGVLAIGPAHAANWAGWIGLALSIALGTVFVGYVLGTKTLEAVVAVVVGKAASLIPGGQ